MFTVEERKNLYCKRVRGGGFAQSAGGGYIVNLQKALHKWKQTNRSNNKSETVFYPIGVKRCFIYWDDLYITYNPEHKLYNLFWFF